MKTSKSKKVPKVTVSVGLDAFKPADLPGTFYSRYKIPDGKNVYKPHGFTTSSRFITDLMESPEDKPCTTHLGQGNHRGDWWNDEQLLGTKENLVEFGSAVWDYHDPTVKKSEHIIDGREFCVQRNPSKEDLAMSAFARYWLFGTNDRPKDGTLGSLEFSKYMRKFKVPEQDLSARPAQETVVAKGLELFMKWKDALATDRDFVLYRSLPRKNIGKDASFLSVGCFYMAARYIGKERSTPVKHAEKDGVVAMIFIPVGTPVLKIVQNLGYTQVVEYLLPPGTLCPVGSEITKPFHDNGVVPVQPVIYVPGKRFRTTQYESQNAAKQEPAQQSEALPPPANIPSTPKKPRSIRKPKTVTESIPLQNTDDISPPKPQRVRKPKTVTDVDPPSLVAVDMVDTAGTSGTVNTTPSKPRRVRKSKAANVE